ncbi:MAG: T9SS type A sorting domain-containing protein [Marinilabiliaceae bacterium]|nr:T9SS type A sorting domain-containing protein [Marinilabiliaceae bacterium]
MKKVFTLLTVLVICMTAWSQANHSFTELKSAAAIDQPKSITFEEWDGNAWTNPSTSNYEYDEQGRTIEVETGDCRILYEYDIDDRISLLTTQTRSGNVWSYVSRTTYEYDDDGETITDFVETWTGTSWIIDHGYKTVCAYNLQDQLISSDYSVFNGTDWEVQKRMEYTYSPMGILASKTEVNKEKVEYFFDEQNQVNKAYHYQYNSTDYVLKKRYIDMEWYNWDPVGHVEESYALRYIMQSYRGYGDINADTSYRNKEKLLVDYPEPISFGLKSKDGTIAIPSVVIKNTNWWEASAGKGTGAWEPRFRETTTFIDENNHSCLMERARETMPYEFTWKNSWFMEISSTPFQVVAREEDYTSGVLSDGSIQTTTYDFNGNVTETETQAYDEGIPGWEIVYHAKNNYVYDDGTSRIISIVFQNYNFGTQLFENVTRTTHSYGATAVKTVETGAVFIYPTVVESELMIETEHAGMATFYAITGQEMKRMILAPGVNSVVISDIPDGYYIIYINTLNGFKQYRIIK